jgi:hypothetical protein
MEISGGNVDPPNTSDSIASAVVVAIDAVLLKPLEQDEQEEV